MNIDQVLAAKPIPALPGQLDGIQAIAAIPPEQPELQTGRCPKCRQVRLLFPFSYVPCGWVEFQEIDLCARCFSAATVEDEESSIPYIDPILDGAS